MRKVYLLLLTMLLLVGLAACGKGTVKEEKSENEVGTKTIGYPQLSPEVADNEELVVINTTLGPIEIKLFPEIAPKAVENFLTHAKDGYYDGVIFHRVMDEFMIQGGDPEGTGAGGESIYGGSFEDEFSESVFHLRGALSMANAGPNTNGSQFFIVQNTNVDTNGLNHKITQPDEIKKAYEEMGGTPHLDHSHTVFGQVTKGMETVDKIARVEENQTRPIEDILIESIDILTKK
ncbi:peptidylprolyl isomerase [Sporosarcina sp. G11-34]|uniref:peptidylprolyl isomerase n=1 Tax=Sporosarcina sp. G11-34 TaxID=2849605 RepID=UPI0022A99260|nr:peptidylprolyl isomerase [Sporosarcina sp. G11-34]MCZ2260447.1 peptidylprolyl isomerase [Sporosarcina sp. G11-34]